MVATALPAPAFAYLDPGTASLVLQGVIGGAVAFFGVVSMYFARVRQFVFGRKSNDPAEARDTGEN